MRQGTRHVALRLWPLAFGPALFALAACSDSPTEPVSDNDSAPERTEVALPDRPFYHGAFLGDEETQPGRVSAAITRFAGRAGQTPALVKSFFTLDSDFSSEGWAGRLVREVAASGATNLVALDLGWAGAPSKNLLSLVVAGDADVRLTRVARGLAELDGPVLVEPGWEMNGNWAYAWQGVANGGARDAAARFVAAWRRVVDVFRAAGATNVRFVFSPNVGNPVAGRAAGASHWNWYGHYYPGDAYVDYVGAHGFHAPTLWGGSYQEFTALFDGAEADRLLSDLAMRFPSKPILISEFAAEETPGHDKGRWIEQAYAFLERHPAVVGAVWFDMRKEADWRVDSSASALAAYRLALGGPRSRTRFEGP
jgi:hypothetical protein